MLLAIGKGSGSFEIWLCDISSKEFDKLGSYDAHDYIVSFIIIYYYYYYYLFSELVERLKLHSSVDFFILDSLQITGLAWAFGGRCLCSCSQVIIC